MARSLPRRLLPFWFVVLVVASTPLTPDQSSDIPEFDSASLVASQIVHDANWHVEFEVTGRNLYSNMQIRITKTRGAKNSECTDLLAKTSVNELWSHRTKAQYVLELPRSAEGDVYFCLLRPASSVRNSLFTANEDDANLNSWLHQGVNVTLMLEDKNRVVPRNAEAQHAPTETNRMHHEEVPMYQHFKLSGVRIDSGDQEVGMDEGIPEILATIPYTIRLFGQGFAESMFITFTKAKATTKKCNWPEGKVFSVIVDDEFTARADVSLPIPTENGEIFYICLKKTHESTEDPRDSSGFIHQGNEPWIALRATQNLLPVWAAIMIICICLAFSALFSGLNLGLMSMDRTDLKILCNIGSSKERRYAKIIAPVREHGNYLLCSILLGNVLVNSIFTILLDSLTSGLFAVIFSTLAIVIFGEITPQAVCSRHGLAVGANTIYITKIVEVLTAPLAYPISKLLDCILGEEIGNVYNRERLKELVKLTTTSGANDLDKDEVNIISGALELRKKTVAEVMTRIEDVFMLDYEAVLDFETVSEIMKSGFSRIPVFEGNRNNIVTMLYIKDLAFVDPDDNTPLKTLCQFYQNPCNFVFQDVTLDVMFKIFKEGNKGHMAFVHRVNNEGEGDPFYETIGLITLEDVIEELIQAEIMDETDVFTDNRSKRRRKEARNKKDFSMFAEKKGESNRLRISPQMTLAAYQFLNTSVDPFKETVLSETVLRRLLKKDIFFHIKKIKDWKNDPAAVIYEKGKPVDYFVLILEGRVEVTVGNEELMFESGPFTYFGIQALTLNVGVAESPSTPVNLGSLQSLNMDSVMRFNFQPDYSVKACTDVLYMKVSRNLYMAAKRATLMERSRKDANATHSDQFDDEVDKLLHSVDEDEDCIEETSLHSDRNGGVKSPKGASKQFPAISSASQKSSTTRATNGPLRTTLSNEESATIGSSNEEEVFLLPKK